MCSAVAPNWAGKNVWEDSRVDGEDTSLMPEAEVRLILTELLA